MFLNKTLLKNNDIKYNKLDGIQNRYVLLFIDQFSIYKIIY